MALYHLRELHPDADVICICSDHAATASTFCVHALPFSGIFREPAISAGSSEEIGAKDRRYPDAPTSIVQVPRYLGGTEVLVVPGYRLLPDASGL